MPEEQTSYNSQQTNPKAAVTDADVMDLFASGPLPVATFNEKILKIATRRKGASLKSQLIDDDRLIKMRRPGGSGRGIEYIGTPEQLNTVARRWQDE